jgi:hypothetical protein
MSTIPEVRVALKTLADKLALMRLELDLMEQTLRAAERELWRRPAKKRAPIKRNRVTKAIIAGVWAEYRRDPNQNNTEIGDQFNIDGGRVSEILSGKRT